MATETVDTIEEEPEVPEAPSERETQEAAFENFLNPPEETEEPSEKTSVETPDEQPETDETVTPPASAEGPSAAMQEVAIQSGLPEQLVSLARDDAQLREMVGLARNSRQEETPAEPEADVFEISLPEDEFDKDDPIRQEFEKMQGFYTKKLDRLKDDMGVLVNVASELHQAHEQSQQRTQQDFQAQFDGVLDELQNPSLGKFGELTEAQALVREATFKHYVKLHEQSPNRPLTEVAQQSAIELFPGLADQQKAEAQKEKLRQQSHKRLGGGPSAPAPEPHKSREEAMEDFLKTLH